MATMATVSGGEVRILVVDDYPDTVEIICTMLSLMGHHTVGVTTGEAALAELERFEPMLVLLDLGLPDIDGFEVARTIRRRCGSAPYLAALTGWGSPEDRRLASRAGFDAFILKPAGLGVIRRLLAAFESKPAAAPLPALEPIAS